MELCLLIAQEPVIEIKMWTKKYQIRKREAEKVAVIDMINNSL